ncbi:hypothetical protein QJS04_geneDACA022466 [Acorus gramineus]|uniref:Uncharacterized protein n=1 Tax=Acorus gramineus TaxID=55184 RepID=A0AAV9BJP7_ACOGR|nr:hypothetical protein QJS04_geneDACA022466 [Acorus gramineus]
MASSTKQLLSLLSFSMFLLTSSHARESHFFTKVQKPKPKPTQTFQVTPVENDESEPPVPPFVVPENTNGYGLYGRDRYGSSTTTTKILDSDHQIPSRPYNAEVYEREREREMEREPYLSGRSMDGRGREGMYFDGLGEEGYVGGKSNYGGSGGYSGYGNMYGNSGYGEEYVP